MSEQERDRRWIEWLRGRVITDAYWTPTDCNSARCLILEFDDGTKSKFISEDPFESVEVEPLGESDNE